MMSPVSSLGSFFASLCEERKHKEKNKAPFSTNKKISNRKLKMELGVPLKYPTFRQGYTAEMLVLDRAGRLDIKPEPR